ncbi:hypothetical protein BGS_0014 [Beggiatoa sp. SS]|nr:hypothetical protein BGS_0014 [Beggiatoa sp. SS]
MNYSVIRKILPKVIKKRLSGTPNSTATFVLLRMEIPILPKEKDKTNLLPFTDIPQANHRAPRKQLGTSICPTSGRTY